jgi:hypothetical protein
MRNRFLSRFAGDELLEQQMAEYIIDLLEKDAIRKYRKKTYRPAPSFNLGSRANNNGFVLYFRHFKAVVAQHEFDKKKIVFSVWTLGDDEVEEGEVIDYDVQYLPVSKMGDIYPNSPEYKILQKLMYKMIDSMR